MALGKGNGRAPTAAGADGKAGGGVQEPAGGPAPGPASEAVWRELERASFAVIGYVTPAGEPRSSGVVYKAIDRRLYVAVGPDSWKARHIAASGRVSVTVPLRRGGILALMAPIPPATISFHGPARVHAPGSAPVAALLEALGALLPPARQDEVCVIEIEPQGEFLTYGLGVSLLAMRDPAVAQGRAPVVAGKAA